MIDDIRRDHDEHGHRWGDVALLYRKHSIGERLETAFLNAGIPCRLAQGRALSDDPVVAYVLAAVRVISCPDDVVYRDAFLKTLLPKALYLEAQAEAERSQQELRVLLRQKANALPDRMEEPRGNRSAAHHSSRIDYRVAVATRGQAAVDAG
jgi:superfamily I DNA/RNA helicase